MRQCNKTEGTCGKGSFSPHGGWGAETDRRGRDHYILFKVCSQRPSSLAHLPQTPPTLNNPSSHEPTNRSLVRPGPSWSTHLYRTLMGTTPSSHEPLRDTYESNFTMDLYQYNMVPDLSTVLIWTILHTLRQTVKFYTTKYLNVGKWFLTGILTYIPFLTKTMYPLTSLHPLDIGAFSSWFLPKHKHKE